MTFERTRAAEDARIGILFGCFGEECDRGVSDQVPLAFLQKRLAAESWLAKPSAERTS